MKRFAGKFAKGLAVALLSLMTWASPGGIPAACAHSVLVSSEPKIDETVTPGPRDLTLVFDSRVDPHRSRIFMTLPDGARQTLTPELGQTQGTLILHVDQLPVGQIYLNYEVLSVDGHIARGVVKFSVAAP